MRERSVCPASAEEVRKLLTISGKERSQRRRWMLSTKSIRSSRNISERSIRLRRRRRKEEELRLLGISHQSLKKRKRVRLKRTEKRLKKERRKIKRKKRRSRVRRRKKTRLKRRKKTRRQLRAKRRKRKAERRRRLSRLPRRTGPSGARNCPSG